MPKKTWAENKVIFKFYKTSLDVKTFVVSLELRMYRPVVIHNSDKFSVKHIEIHILKKAIMNIAFEIRVVNFIKLSVILLL